TLLEKLGKELPERYYLGVDVGYKEHVAAVIDLETFVRGGERWKRARCLHFPSTQRGLDKFQHYLDHFSSTPQTFLGVCEPTGGCYGATVYQYLLDRMYPTWMIENALTRHMREKIMGGIPKTDETDARVMARICYLHEAVGEEFKLRPLRLAKQEEANLLAMCRDSWKLSQMIVRGKNQFTQLMAVYCSTLQCSRVSRTEDVFHQERVDDLARDADGNLSNASGFSGGDGRRCESRPVESGSISSRPSRGRTARTGSPQLRPTTRPRPRVAAPMVDGLFAEQLEGPGRVGETGGSAGDSAPRLSVDRGCSLRGASYVGRHPGCDGGRESLFQLPEVRGLHGLFRRIGEVADD
ncbi:MAG: transposase, partial [Chloroflexota bacterium]|nr:transposase [Chloroflexota bacterium]